ncbi:MAG: histidinol-phosphate transaminase [Candidatus Tectomicrobia bacterium]|uniref:Histidinol-phosphate aminotransferase n=1 Tax=Tectimicrobiota bacterium TaxID=2528274 RepID=A0A937W0J7_UNCTE|nr:histidinol-phosphate transaminase [Candidatus Tectomicrobia bacterium]
MRVDEVIGNVRRCIRAMEGYVPGKQPADGNYIKLNTNENPYPPSPRVLAALQEAIGADLRLYSDPVAWRLRETAAALYGCAVDEVIAGNGSDDILTMIFRTFLDAGDSIATPAPSYTLYNALSALQNATCTEVPMGPDYTLPADLDDHGAKVVFIVNPNAPTGVLHPREALREFLARTQSIVVIDEAYADFAGESAIDMIAEFPHLIVTRTFSKSYALAGMRLGLGFARREVIAEMMKVKDSYNLDRLAIVAGCAALQDQDWLHETVGMIVRTRTWMQHELEAMGLYVPPSRSNFVFPTLPHGRAAAVYEALEKQHILVRYFRNSRVQDSLRVSVGTDAEAETFVRALRTLLA